MQHYPVYLDLRDRPCFVIGGCGMAEEKVKGLVAAGARATVISPDPPPPLSGPVGEGKEGPTPPLSGLGGEGKITPTARRYRRGDLRAAFLVVVVSQPQLVTQTVWEET